MNQQRFLELSVGAFVALGLAALLVLALKVSNLAQVSRDGGYHLTARFDNIGGLKVRSPVTIAGVRVGQVSEIAVDPQTYEAVVRLMVSSQYRLPRDTAAQIYTAGLLGEQYVALEPGGEEDYLQDGDEIQLTQSAIVLERVLGQFLFSKAAGD